MSKNDYLLTGTGTLSSLLGLLVLLALYSAACGLNTCKLYQAFRSSESARLHRLQALLFGALGTLLLRMLWILYCILTAGAIVAVFLSVAPHVCMNALGSALCYFWCEMCLNAEESRKKRWSKYNGAGVLAFNFVSLAGLFLAAVDWRGASEWTLWEHIYLSNLVLSFVLAAALIVSGRLVYHSVRGAIRTDSGERAARRLKNMSQWCACGFTLKGVLPSIIFLKEIDTSHTVDRDGFQVAFLVVLAVLTELLPLLIILRQLRVSQSRSESFLNSNEESPSINTLDPPPDSSSQSVDISSSFLLA